MYLISFGTPILAFLGGLFGHLISRRGDVELERRSRREEVMRNLRWAAELAVSQDEPKARLGVAQLRSLLDSKIIGDDEKESVQAALGATISPLVAQIEQMEHGGEDVRVVLDSGLPVDEDADVPLDLDLLAAAQSWVPEDKVKDKEGES